MFSKGQFFLFNQTSKKPKTYNLGEGLQRNLTVGVGGQRPSHAPVSSCRVRELISVEGAFWLWKWVGLFKIGFSSKSSIICWVVHLVLSRKKWDEPVSVIDSQARSKTKLELKKEYKVEVMWILLASTRTLWCHTYKPPLRNVVKILTNFLDLHSLSIL